jgi:hypothetical protein
MTFTQIREAFEGAEPGTDLYKDLQRECLAMIKKEPANAAAYFLISQFSRSYVILFEEEAVTVDVAAKAKAQMLDYLTRLENVSTQTSAEARLSAVNSIVLDYLQSDRIF